LIVSHSVLRRVRNVSDKSCREGQYTHFTFSNLFFFNRVICELMWKNIVQPDRTHTTVWHMHIACWIRKAINTLRICNTCCFCTSTVVRRTRISVALYVHFLSCFLLNSELLGFEKLLFVRNIRISGSTSPTEKKNSLHLFNWIQTH
jgi:hypothetical protein